MQFKNFLVDIGMLILKFTWKGKGTIIAKTVLQKNNNVGGTTLLNFKTCCEVLYSRQWLW